MKKSTYECTKIAISRPMMDFKNFWKLHTHGFHLLVWIAPRNSSFVAMRTLMMALSAPTPHDPLPLPRPLSPSRWAGCPLQTRRTGWGCSGRILSHLRRGRATPLGQGAAEEGRVGEGGCSCPCFVNEREERSDILAWTLRGRPGLKAVALFLQRSRYSHCLFFSAPLWKRCPWTREFCRFFSRLWLHNTFSEKPWVKVKKILEKFRESSLSLNEKSLSLEKVLRYLRWKFFVLWLLTRTRLEKFCTSHWSMNPLELISITIFQKQEFWKNLSLGNLLSVL